MWRECLAVAMTEYEYGAYRLGMYGARRLGARRRNARRLDVQDTAKQLGVTL